MATIINNIEHFFKQRSVLSTLIFINIAVFLLIKIIGGFLLLFQADSGIILDWMELPSDLGQLMARPWTLLTYMFTHTDFWHILFNLLWLYWFGKLFLLFFSPRQMGGLYVLGGLAGGILFMLGYNFLPYFREAVSFSYLIGASASVMAIVFAAAFFKKDFEVSFLFLGNIKIFYLALFCLLMDLLAIQSPNSGGHMAHIGGALIGIWFAELIKKGQDITGWLNSLIDVVVNLFKRKSPSMRVQYRRPVSDYDYNDIKNKEAQEIDRILDKIKHSGYSSLSSEEKKKLFDAGNK